MIIEIEKELVEIMKSAKEDGNTVLVRCCELTGVRIEGKSHFYAPDVEGDCDQSRIAEMDRMVNDRDISIKFARLIRLYLAVKGHLLSQFNEGYNFHFGRNIPRDYEIARYWYTIAAQRGDKDAQNNLGVLYANGLGGDRDFEKAVYWYTKSADGGDDVAKGNLAELLIERKGIKKSYRLAAKLLKEYLKAYPYSAKKHQLLGECYEHGAGGRNSRKLAIHHYQEASDFGSSLARKALRRLTRNKPGCAKAAVTT